MRRDVLVDPSDFLGFFFLPSFFTGIEIRNDRMHAALAKRLPLILLTLLIVCLLLLLITRVCLHKYHDAARLRVSCLCR